MRMCKLLVVFMLLISTSLFAQSGTVKWDSSFNEDTFFVDGLRFSVTFDKSHNFYAGRPYGVWIQNMGLVIGMEKYKFADLDSNRSRNGDLYSNWVYVGAFFENRYRKSLHRLEIDFGLVDSYSLSEYVITRQYTTTHMHTHKSHKPHKPHKCKPHKCRHKHKTHHHINTVTNTVTEMELYQTYSADYEPGILIRYDDYRRFYRHKNEIDIIGHLDITLGNIETAVSYGVMHRIGVDMPLDFSLADTASKVRESALFYFIKPQVKFVAWNKFLDDVAVGDYKVHKFPIVLQAIVGVRLMWKNGHFGYEHTFQTREFHEQDSPYGIGSLVLTQAF